MRTQGVDLARVCSDPRYAHQVRSIFVSALLWRSWIDAFRRSHGARLLGRHDQPPGNHQSMLCRSRTFRPTNRRSSGIGLSVGGADPDAQPGPQRPDQIRKPSRVEVPGVICIPAVNGVAVLRPGRSVNCTLMGRSWRPGYQLEPNSNGLAADCRIWINRAALARSTLPRLLLAVGAGRSRIRVGRAAAQAARTMTRCPYYDIDP